MKTRAEVRVQTAQQKVQGREEDLRQLEQEVLKEVQEIDRRWQEQADQIDELRIGVEAADVDVDELAVVWIPTA